MEINSSQTAPLPLGVEGEINGPLILNMLDQDKQMSAPDQINEPSPMENADPQQFLATGSTTTNQIDIDNSHINANSTAQNLESN